MKGAKWPLSALWAINTCMKLYEIIQEHEFPKAKERDVKNVPDLYDYDDEDAYWDDEDEPPEKSNPAKDKDIERLGTGAFATAYKHKKNPYDVVKGSKASKEPDGFVSFYDALAKDEEAQSNPYFPRFRDMSKYRGDDDRKSYIARMEPLEPYKNLSKRERKMLVNKIFNEHGSDVINHYWEEEQRKLPQFYGKGNTFPGEKFAWAIRAALENQEWGDELRWTIEDEKFEQAIEFLQEAAEKSGFELDMHFNNLMVRRTSLGPQLVFNDPFGMSSSADDEDEIDGHPDWE